MMEEHEQRPHLHAPQPSQEEIKLYQEWLEEKKKEESVQNEHVIEIEI